MNARYVYTYSNMVRSIIESLLIDSDGHAHRAKVHLGLHEYSIYIITHTSSHQRSVMLKAAVYLLLLGFPRAAHSEEHCGGLQLDSWTDKEVVVEIHRNGDPHSCGSVKITAKELASFDTPGKCLSDLNKYDVESFLTRLLSDKLDDQSCLNLDDEEPSPGFFGYCDRGSRYTPILNDHGKLVRVPSGSLPCRFHTREGLRITSIDQFADLAMEKEQSCENQQTDCGKTAHIHVYGVSAGRVFMFAPSYVGEIFELPHVDVDSGLPVYVEVLNMDPRVFEVYNFFSKEESDHLVKKAIAETSETHKIKRSTTGAGENTVFSKITSESGFDTHGEIAQKVKRRCMMSLGFDKYIEGHTDGLQILRYNVSKAYTPHMDYMDDRRDSGGKHDYKSEFTGGNRFATILLYMTGFEAGEGGETVFSRAWPPGSSQSERKELPAALDELRASGDASVLKEGSWEEKMVATCRSKFSVRPNAARAILFYSQFPNGKEDQMSTHGGCPVLNPDKVSRWCVCCMSHGL